MKNLIITMLVLIAGATSASALELQLQPGELQANKVLLANTRDAELTLTGTATAADLDVLKFMARNIKTLDMSGLTVEGGELPESMFLGSAVEQVKLPAQVSVIGNSAFAGSALQSVTIGSQVTKIGDYAFSACNNLKTADIEGNPTLGVGIFKDDSKLVSVNSSFAPQEIPESMFDGCYSLVTPIAATVRKIGAFGYRGTCLTSIDLSNMEQIGAFAFANMPQLTEITIPEGKQIEMGDGVFFGDGAFQQWDKITDVSSDLMLAHTSGRDSLVVRSAVVGKGAYANNSRLKELTLGSEVRQIGAHAFRNASNLRIIYAKDLGTNPPEVSDQAFSGLENEEGNYDVELNVDNGAADVWKENPVWKKFNIMAGGSDVGSIMQTALTVDVKREQGNITVHSSCPIDYIGIYSTDGIVLTEVTPDSEHWSGECVETSAPVIIKVISNGSTKIVKLQ